MNGRRVKSGLLLLLLPVLVACAGLPDTSDRLWPFRNEESAEAGPSVLDVAWPFWHEEETEDSREVRLRPFYRRIVEDDGKTVRGEALWPLVLWKDGPEKESLRILPLWHDRTLRDDEGRNDRDWMFFPLLWGGSDPDEGDYLLLFPFWGNTRGLFGRPEVRFRFFPLYLETEDVDYEGRHLLWPFIAWGEGETRSDFRFLPFYSTTEVEGKRWAKSVLWPLVSWGEDGLNTEHPTETFLFLPFYGRVDSDVAWSRLWFLPLYMESGNDDGYRDLNLLWPVFRKLTTPDEDRWSLRFWPLFSRTVNGETVESYYLWPIVWDSTNVSPNGRVESFQIVPFYRSTEYLSGEGESRGSQTQVWPLFEHTKAADGSYRLNALAPIPFVDWEPFEAHWDWAWTLMDLRVVRDVGTSLSLAGGLVQYRGTAEGTYAGVPLLLEFAEREDASKLHLVKGLLGWETGAEGAALRLLWLLRIGF